jgi:hypothetical protein
MITSLFLMEHNKGSKTNIITADLDLRLANKYRRHTLILESNLEPNPRAPSATSEWAQGADEREMKYHRHTCHASRTPVYLWIMLTIFCRAERKNICVHSRITAQMGSFEIKLNS